jgi:hypothetical protein
MCSIVAIGLAEGAIAAAPSRLAGGGSYFCTALPNIAFAIDEYVDNCINFAFLKDEIDSKERAFQHLASRAGSAGECAEKPFRVPGMQLTVAVAL